MEFQDVARQIDRWVEDGAVQGASIAIELRGELVALHQAGEARPGAPVDEDTLFALASVSKPVTVAAFMRVVEQGLVALDDTVSDILHDFGHFDDPLMEGINPAFEAERDSITFRQLLAHTSGLPENAAKGLIRIRELPSMNEQVDAMLQTPLISAPGERLRYSNLGPAIAARAIEEITGSGIHELIQHLVLDPMGLDSIVLTPGGSYDERIAQVQDPSNEGTPAESYNSRYWRDMGITWGGYFGSPKDVLRFATSFLPGRETVLSPDSISAMTTDQVGGVPGGVESMGAIWDPGFWGAGWEVKGTKRKHWTGAKSSPATFCHWGQAGTLAWVDPKRELGVAVFGSRTVRTLWPFRPPRWSELNDAIVDIADTKG
jgi:CubicO group peptidase (beta-lactamase class C family)